MFLILCFFELSMSFIVGDFYYKTTSKDTVKISSYKGSSSSVKIPKEVEYDKREYDVTEIDRIAFALNEAIVTVEIPDTIKVIGEEAFSGCSMLQNVRFDSDSDLEKIENMAFFKCSSLESIEFPERLEEIGSMAFIGCNLKYVKFTNSLKSVGESAFDINNNIREVRAKDSAKDYYEDGIFYTKDYKNIVLRKYDISKISLDKRLIRIQPGFFKNLKLSKKKVVLNRDLVMISEEAFMGTNLNSVEIDYNVNSIGEKAFYGCSELSEIVFHNPAVTIGKNAFTGTGLNGTVIQTPNNFVEIKENAFSNIKFKQINIESCDTKIDRDAFTVDGDTCIRVPYRCESEMKIIFNVPVNQPECPDFYPTQTPSPLESHSLKKEQIIYIVVFVTMGVFLTILVIIIKFIKRRQKPQYQNIYEEFPSVDPIEFIPPK